VVHDDTPRLHWKLSIVHDLVKSNDGLVCSAHISTANYKAYRKITRLFPLEVVSHPDDNLIRMSSEDSSPTVSVEQQSNTDIQNDNPAYSRPKRTAATRAMKRISEWTNTLLCPRRNVENRL